MTYFNTLVAAVDVPPTIGWHARLPVSSQNSSQCHRKHHPVHLGKRICFELFHIHSLFHSQEDKNTDVYQSFKIYFSETFQNIIIHCHSWALLIEQCMYTLPIQSLQISFAWNTSNSHWNTFTVIVNIFHLRQKSARSREICKSLAKKGLCSWKIRSPTGWFWKARKQQPDAQSSGRPTLAEWCHWSFRAALPPSLPSSPRIFVYPLPCNKWLKLIQVKEIGYGALIMEMIPPSPHLQTEFSAETTNELDQLSSQDHSPSKKLTLITAG